MCLSQKSTALAAMLVFLVGLISTTPTRASDVRPGIMKIWIPGSRGASCISASSDTIAVGVARLKINKDDSFWRHEKNVGIENQLMVSSGPTSFSYSQMYDQDISEFSGDILDVPVEDVVGGPLILHTSDNGHQTLTDIFRLDTFESQTSAPSTATKALLSLQQVSQSLPTNPYSPEIKMASDMSSVLVNNLIDASKDDEKQTIGLVELEEQFRLVENNVA
jgi:hypothetical protein